MPTSEEIIVTSRSFAEYCAFFGLDEESLPARILDAAAGASSFIAEVSPLVERAVAVDPAYEDRETTLARARAGLAAGTQLVDAHSGHFVLDWYGSAERRAEMRHAALARFADDFEGRPEHYVGSRLPALPFETDSFDLALCSHLLFTWATHLDEAFHRAALTELLRVAREVRVFPLALQGTGAPVSFLDSLREAIERDLGASTEVVGVPYEFQRGVNQMLVITR